LVIDPDCYAHQYRYRYTHCDEHSYTDVYRFVQRDLVTDIHKYQYAHRDTYEFSDANKYDHPYSHIYRNSDEYQYTYADYNGFFHFDN
jgi:hypothetical protein